MEVVTMSSKQLKYTLQDEGFAFYSLFADNTYLTLSCTNRYFHMEDFKGVIHSGSRF